MDKTKDLIKRLTALVPQAQLRIELGLDANWRVSLNRRSSGYKRSNICMINRVRPTLEGALRALGTACEIKYNS